jgi:N-sulfoglucosamine sulfohydrolase
MSKPHIIYIHSHDTGRYVQPYGYAIPTPHIQRLAEEGVLFRQAFCANPTCSPSRACLLTGQWAHSCGMGGLVNRGWSLPHTERLLPHFLRTKGYQTVCTGIQHVVKDPEQGGYERLESGEGGDESTAERAVAFLREEHARPFFLDVGFVATHRRAKVFDDPPAGEAPTDPRYVVPPAPLPDTPETRADMALYIDAARRLDSLMGKVFAALDASGLADNTLVICTTDHGIAFPRMKCNLTDHGMGVMLVMRGPGGFKGGEVIDGLVSHVDLFPTICAVADIERPDWLQGESLLPLIHGTDSQVREAVFAETNYHVCYEPQRAVRTARWKYIRRLHERAQPLLPDCDDSTSKDYLLENGWDQREEAEERLYDLLYDPHESCNLAADPACAEVLASLQAQLEVWRRETEDPLLTDPVFVPPATAEIAAPDERSPGLAPAFNARAFLGVE